MQSLFRLLARTAVAAATSAGSQNFLGAKWVSASLDLAPKGWKRSLALRYLALSPHYFYRNSANAELTAHDFLESEYNRNLHSRQIIIDEIISKHLEPGLTCLDYGCGPGFLAHSVAPRVAKVVACDISEGVLACARVINFDANIDYRCVAANGAIPVSDEEIDFAYSFGVVQHVTDDVFRGILSELRRALKPSGIVVCHVVLDGHRGWRSEAAWRADKTVKGRLKWRFGMWCSSRSRDCVEKLITEAGFRSLQIIPVMDSGIDLLGGYISGHLCVCTR